jgi:toxin ParE1/3/4
MNVDYRVRIGPRAARDLAMIYDATDAGLSDPALRWYEGLRAAILSLEKQPKIWPVTPESRRLRHLFYGRKPHRVYRVIYRIEERKKLVDVLHIRHGARERFKPEDMK